MDTCWVPAVNNLGTLGRWAFAELTEVYRIEADFEARVDREFDAMLERAGAAPRRPPDAARAPTRGRRPPSSRFFS
jgi:hypothetical protein